MKSFAVIGCGRFGTALATTLFKLGYDVLAIDINEEVIQNLSSQVTKAVVAHPDKETLKEIGIGSCDVVVVSIGSEIEASVITTLIVKEIGIPYIICKAGSDLQARILYKIGADKVITPEKEMGIKVAKSLVSENILDKIDLDPNFTIFEVMTPKNWINKSLIELDIRKKYKLNVVAIKKNETFDLTLDPNEPLKEHYVIVLIGHNEDLKNFEKKINIEIV